MRKLGPRDRLLVAVVGALGPLLVRCLGLTWRITIVGEEAVDTLHDAGRRVVHAFWHGHLLGLEYAYRNRAICVLSSWHRDGEISARVMSGLGYEVVRGSTSRGSARGLLGMLSKLKAGHDVAVTPDGPRGPARVVKPGLFYLSEKSGSPIVPVAVWSRPSKRLGSWDDFAIPLPFARVAIVHGPPIEPEPSLDIEDRSEELAQVLESLTREARGLIEV
jgi:lysophospholipid acyltransferase (LPLAT)-like uncharacterized protein